MKRAFFFFLCIWLCLGADAQEYQQSAGLRLGHTSGFTYKKFVNQATAFEFLLSGRRAGLQVTGLYLHHTPVDLNFHDKFYFIYGLGVHAGVERYAIYRKMLDPGVPRRFTYVDDYFLAIGVDGFIGAEYRIQNFPLTIGLEVKPYINFVGFRHLDFMFWDFALTFKYIF